MGWRRKRRKKPPSLTYNVSGIWGHPIQLEVLIQQLVTWVCGSQLEMDFCESSVHSLWLKLWECLSSSMRESTREGTKEK